MGVLSAYLRQHALGDPDVETPAHAVGKLPVDHQAIATVIGRRRTGRDP